MMKRITKVLLPLLMLGFVLFSAGCDSDILELPREVDNPPKEAELPEEEKIYWEGTIEEDFDGSSVLVVMDKYTGGINKKHEDSYFGDFEKVYVKDLTAITKDIKDALIDVEKFRQILMIKLPIDSKENVVRVIRELEKIKGILAACPNHYYYPSAMPDDQGYTWQWGLWSTMGIQAEDAWDITPGSDSVRVGIIDTGISPHPDLNGNLVAGWNFVDDNNNTADTEGHGTKVAGVVGAVGNNSVGMTGVCWNVSLVPLKIENGGYATLGLADRIISALIYAEDNDISIVNLSWGGLGYNVAMSYAIISYDGLFICAAGNDSVDIDATPTYPACHFNTVSVGSIGPTGDLSDISNWGAHYVDLFAPGDSIFTTTLVFRKKQTTR